MSGYRLCKGHDEAVNYALLLSVLGHTRVEVYGFRRAPGDQNCLVGAVERATPPLWRSYPLLGSVHPGGHPDESLIRWYTGVRWYTGQVAPTPPNLVLGLLETRWMLWVLGPIAPLGPK